MLANSPPSTESHLGKPTTVVSYCDLPEGPQRRTARRENCVAQTLPLRSAGTSPGKLGKAICCCKTKSRLNRSRDLFGKSETHRSPSGAKFSPRGEPTRVGRKMTVPVDGSRS